MQLPEKLDSYSSPTSLMEVQRKLNEIIDYLAEREKKHMEIISNLTNLLLSDRPLNQERE